MLGHLRTNEVHIHILVGRGVERLHGQGHDRRDDDRGVNQSRNGRAAAHVPVQLKLPFRGSRERPFADHLPAGVGCASSETLVNPPWMMVDITWIISP